MRPAHRFAPGNNPGLDTLSLNAGCGKDVRLSNIQLEGISAKVERARATLLGLETGINEHCEAEVRRLESAARERSPLAADVDEPDTIYDYAVAVGEVAYNLRSGLDHLVWQLVLANRGKPDTQTEFPIFRKESDYRRDAERKLHGLTDDQLRMVEELQPFRDAINIGPHLWMLRTICNIDKHRHLNVVSTHYIMRDTGYEHRVKDGVVVEVCFRDPKLEEASPGYGSAFETIGPIKRPPVVPALQSCLTAVVNVVELLTGELVAEVASQKSHQNCG